MRLVAGFQDSGTDEGTPAIPSSNSESEGLLHKKRSRAGHLRLKKEEKGKADKDLRSEDSLFLGDLGN